MLVAATSVRLGAADHELKEAPGWINLNNLGIEASITWINLGSWTSWTMNYLGVVRMPLTGGYWRLAVLHLVSRFGGVHCIWLLVGGLNPWKILVRQLGWWNSQLNGWGHEIHVPNHQPDICLWHPWECPKFRWTWCVHFEMHPWESSLVDIAISWD